MRKKFSSVYDYLCFKQKKINKKNWQTFLFPIMSFCKQTNVNFQPILLTGGITFSI